MIISLKKTISIGDMGIIYLMHWCPNKNGEPQDKRKYFSVYYSENYKDAAILFSQDIKDDIVTEDSSLHMILEDYILEQLHPEKRVFSMEAMDTANHLYAEPEEAVFDVFKKLYAEKMLVQDSKEDK